MPLETDLDYFVAFTHVVMRESADPKSDAVNHLLLGDWCQFLGDESGDRAKIRCRGNEGWVPAAALRPHRLLEVNFVDIGQGDGCHVVTPDDEVIVIDAGVSDNMVRFLSWRYNLRSRRVAGVDGVDANDPNAREPFTIDHAIISHPDNDHYLGFDKVFENRKMQPQTIYHNGIVERPAEPKEADLTYPDDLGGYFEVDDQKYVWDIIDTDAQMKALLARHPKTRKQFISTLREAVENNPDVDFRSLSLTDQFVPGFEADKDLTLELLGPVREDVTRNGETRAVLRRLGQEGVTKNGHSIVMQLQFGHLKVMLGGDLNTESQDFLLRHYTGTNHDASDLEAQVDKVLAMGPSATLADLDALAEAEQELDAIVTSGRDRFEVDVAKACHHGSHHFTPAFLKALNACVTVISSGDREQHSHPRPDALGSFGFYGRGPRPLLFSTELARSSREFVSISDYLRKVETFQKKLADATSASERTKIEKEFDALKDRTVVVYGMITLRTDGEKVVLAQKLEVARDAGQKWDIHVLEFNPNTQMMEYHGSGH